MFRGSKKNINYHTRPFKKFNNFDRFKYHQNKQYNNFRRQNKGHNFHNFQPRHPNPQDFNNMGQRNNESTIICQLCDNVGHTARFCRMPYYMMPNLQQPRGTSQVPSNTFPTTSNHPNGQ